MAELRRRLHGDDVPGVLTPTKQRSDLPGSSSRRWERYSKAAQRLGVVAVCAGFAFVGAVAWVVATERTPAFSPGEYVVSFGYQTQKSCDLHGLAAAAAPQLIVDVSVLEPGIADHKLLQLRWEELDTIVNAYVVLVEGEESQEGDHKAWVWDTSDTSSTPPLLRGPGWERLLSKNSHKVTVVVVPRVLLSGSAASSNPSAKAAGDHASGTKSVYSIAGSLASIAVDAGDQWHGGTAYMRALLRQGAAVGLERAGVTPETVLVLGRTHEIPRASTLRLVQMCDTQATPLVLATATYVLSFEFRKPNAFRHSPLTVTAGALLQGLATDRPSTATAGEAAAVVEQPLADAAAEFRTDGIRCLTDAGWTCEHCTRDWSKLEPAAASSLRGMLRLRAGAMLADDGGHSYKSLYQAMCSGEDPLGASRLWGLDVMLSAVGLPRAVREGGATYAHLLPGRCEGGDGAKRLWELMEDEEE
jgi:hypothetical protein